MEIDEPKKAINNALSDLQKITNNIAKSSEIVYKIAEMGVSIAKQEMEKRKIPTNGELGNSIKATQVDANTARLEADGGHATYVEFGTGIVGAETPHKEATERGIQYDRNGHGERGWTYEKNGRFYHTKGVRSKPFWYATGKKLKTEGKKLFVSKLKIKGD